MVSIYKKIALYGLFVLLSMNGMEQNTCYLALLPVEIQDHIASYLTFDDRESDDDFIARTRDFGVISQEHCKLVEEREQKKCVFPDMESGCSSYGTLRAYSVDCSKIISLEMLSKKPNVTVFDINDNETRENIMLTKQLRESEQRKEKMKNFKCIAVSRTGSHFAALSVLGISVGLGSGLLRTKRWPASYISVKNILLEGKQKAFMIPGQYSNFVSIGFNKQGTKIIVHAKENGYWDDVIPQGDMPETFFHIFTLISPEEHEEKSKKTLVEYLKRCCKSSQLVVSE